MVSRETLDALATCALIYVAIGAVTWMFCKGIANRAILARAESGRPARTSEIALSHLLLMLRWPQVVYVAFWQWRRRVRARRDRSDQLRRQTQLLSQRLRDRMGAER